MSIMPLCALTTNRAISIALTLRQIFVPSCNPFQGAAKNILDELVFTNFFELWVIHTKTYRLRVFGHTSLLGPRCRTPYRRDTSSESLLILSPPCAQPPAS